jgi:histidine ammonia-lyase
LISLFSRLRNFAIATISVDAAQGSKIPFDQRVNFLKNNQAQMNYAKIMI